MMCFDFCLQERSLKTFFICKKMYGLPRWQFLLFSRHDAFVCLP